jgi:NAD(P)H-dependent FMN reductase
MKNITIISSSIRTQRKSHNVALYLENYLADHKLATSEILDLKKYNFPLFEERFKNLEKPSTSVLEFAQKIKSSDAIIIVTPEYNGSLPASLKNVIDLLYEEWSGKPIGLSTVSSGIFGGNQCLTHLQFILWKMKATVIQANFPVPNVEKTFDHEGVPLKKEETNKLADLFLKELIKNIK